MRFYILNSFRDIHCQNVPKTFGTPCTYKNLQISGDFIACFYTVTLLLFPVASEAAILDLTFYLTILGYSKNCNSPLQSNATAVNTSLSRHRWFLTAELLPFSLRSKQIKS